MTATAEPQTTIATTIPRSEIARALRAIESVKAKHVWIDLDQQAPTITGHTANVAARVTLDTAAPGGMGRCAIPKKLLAQLVPYLSSDVTLTIEEHHLTIASGDSRYEIMRVREDASEAVPGTGVRRGRHKRASDYRPIIETYGHKLDVAGTKAAEFEAPTLREVLDRTIRFASTDETRPVLRTIALYTDANTAVVTDSYRLAVVRYGDKNPSSDAPPILLNLDAAARKLGKVTIHETNDHYLIGHEDVRWSVRKLEPGLVGCSAETCQGGNSYRPRDEACKACGGKNQYGPPAYPQWEKLLPDSYKTTIKVDRPELLDAARAARVIGTRHQPLKLAITNDGARVTANGADVGTMERKLTTADVTGPVTDPIGDPDGVLDGYEIGLNPEFLAEFCQIAPVERLTIHLIGPLRPIKIDAGRDVHLLMPIRLNV